MVTGSNRRAVTTLDHKGISRPATSQLQCEVAARAVPDAPRLAAEAGIRRYSARPSGTGGGRLGGLVNEYQQAA